MGNPPKQFPQKFPKKFPKIPKQIPNKFSTKILKICIQFPTSHLTAENPSGLVFILFLFFHFWFNFFQDRYSLLFCLLLFHTLDNYTYIKNKIRWFFRAMPQLSANLHTQMTLNLSDKIKIFIDHVNQSIN